MFELGFNLQSEALLAVVAAIATALYQTIKDQLEKRGKELTKTERYILVIIMAIAAATVTVITQI